MDGNLSRKQTERNESCYYTKVVRKRGRRARSDCTRKQRESRDLAWLESPRPVTTSPPDSVTSSSLSIPEISTSVSPPEQRISALEGQPICASPLTNQTGVNLMKPSTSSFSTCGNPLGQYLTGSTNEAGSMRNETTVSSDPVSVLTRKPFSDFQVIDLLRRFRQGL